MVALVLVGHSPLVLRGLRAMLAQAAPGVPVGEAGGTDLGALGTSAPLILGALRSVLREAPDGAVVMLDLGSAALALEMALDDLEPAERVRVRVSRGALVEGAVRAAVEAAGGAGLAAVLAASETPPGTDKLPDEWPANGSAPV
jgi:PTS hybrid protein